jgi:hypothetical protein
LERKMKKIIGIALIIAAFAALLSVRIPDPQAQNATPTPTNTPTPVETIPPLPTIPPTPSKRVILQVVDDVDEGGKLVGWKELVFTRAIVRQYSDLSWYIEFHNQAGCTMQLWFDEANQHIEKCYNPTPLPSPTP